MEHAQEVMIGLVMLLLNLGFIAALITFYLDEQNTPEPSEARAGRSRGRHHRRG